MFEISPITISGKVKLRSPTQSESLSSRYIFNNIPNTEPNLGVPKIIGSSPDPFGIRYCLLSNNSYTDLTTNRPITAWRAWSNNSPTIAAWSIQKSIALGDTATPIRNNSLVYSNHPYGTNRYNSESFRDNTFNIYSLSGIYLFDATTIGDPASATSFIVTNDGFVGINTDAPIERFTINANTSANGQFVITGRTFLGDSKFDGVTARGRIAFSDGDKSFGLVFGDGNIVAQNVIYDTNLYRQSISSLRTDSQFTSTTLSAVGLGSLGNLSLTNANVSLLPTATASGYFLTININGTNRAIRLWDY